VANEAPWYGVCSELRLRLIYDRSLLNLEERLSKELKRRLKDFDLSFSCGCPKPFRHVKTWLEAWRSYYNYVRYHMSLRKAPCGLGG
jgi:transposase-like protein